jgi:O-antigen ligase
LIHNSTLKIHNLHPFNPLLWGTIGYLFLFIFRPFEYWEWLGTYHVERIYMIALIFVIAFSSKGRYRHHPIATVLLSFFGVICFSTLIAIRQDVALTQALEYLKIIVLFFVILLTVKDTRDFRVLLIAFLAITGIYIGKSLWEFLIYGRYVYRMGISRLGGIDSKFGDPNIFAATIMYSLPFAWALWKSNPSPRLKVGLIFYGLMSITSLIFTGSRAGMLTFIFFLFLLWIRGKKKIIGAVGIVLILAIGWYAMPEKYQGRFETIYDESKSRTATASAEGRILGFEMGIQFFKENPIWGLGAGCSPVAMNAYLGYDFQLHNLYAQLLSELGIMGAIPFLILIFLIIRTQSRIAKGLDYSQTGKEDLIFNVSIACTNTLWLLLFEGLGGHNLYRYTWLWISALLILSYQFAMRITAEGKV